MANLCSTAGLIGSTNSIGAAAPPSDRHCWIMTVKAVTDYCRQGAILGPRTTTGVRRFAPDMCGTTTARARRNETRSAGATPRRLAEASRRHGARPHDTGDYVA